MDFLLMDFQFMDFQLIDYIVYRLQLLMDFQFMDFQFMEYLLMKVIVDRVHVDGFDWVIICVSYMLRKISKVSVDFILEHLERAKQKALVLGLVDFCDSEEVDHENLNILIDKVNTDPDFCGGIVQIMQIFLGTQTKFSILGVKIGWSCKYWTKFISDSLWLRSSGWTRWQSSEQSSRSVNRFLLPGIISYYFNYVQHSQCSGPILKNTMKKENF